MIDPTKRKDNLEEMKRLARQHNDDPAGAVNPWSSQSREAVNREKFKKDLAEAEATGDPWNVQKVRNAELRRREELAKMNAPKFGGN
ncbi:hypothetical protein [Jeotgalibacillus terrae]|uniref:Uncharacterized protein n=1 Tax=Jeotgalibacillus terrae TaxID=587735 RepID=A0ABW5ZMZ8_9BACL|nr:hypothetical protein [Jeotgalibacillus terrae]MBM7581094.1 hypothetical protein [Jeotgalibacillus terrae]